MVRGSMLILGVVVTAGLAATGAEPIAAQPGSNPLPEARIGFPKVLFKDVHPKLIDIAARPFKETIQKTAGLHGSLSIVEDYKVLAKQLEEKKLDIAVFHGFEYAWIKEANPDLIPFVVTVPNCGKVQACLVVNVASNAKEPKDLKGECIAIHKGMKAHCQMFLDQLRRDLPSDCCRPMKPEGAPVIADEVLDNVASGYCEAAMVDISSLEAYKNSKPGLGKQLKVLKESELLPSAVVVCRKGSLTPAQIKAISTGLFNCDKNAQGRMFLMFWNLKCFDAPNPEYFELLAKCKIAHPEPKEANK